MSQLAGNVDEETVYALWTLHVILYKSQLEFEHLTEQCESQLIATVLRLHLCHNLYMNSTLEYLKHNYLFDCYFTGILLVISDTNSTRVLSLISNELIW